MKNKRAKNLIILASVLALLIIAYLVMGVISADDGDTTTDETQPNGWYSENLHDGEISRGR